MTTGRHPPGAGVRNPPGKETAGDEALSVQRALMGIWQLRTGWLSGVHAVESNERGR
jgi:hypothetical protein